MRGGRGGAEWRGNGGLLDWFWGMDTSDCAVPILAMTFLMNGNPASNWFAFLSCVFYIRSYALH